MPLKRAVARGTLRSVIVMKGRARVVCSSPPRRERHLVEVAGRGLSWGNQSVGSLHEKKVFGKQNFVLYTTLCMYLLFSTSSTESEITFLKTRSRNSTSPHPIPSSPFYSALSILVYASPFLASHLYYS